MIQRSASLLPILLALTIPPAVRADVVVLNDGTHIPGRVIGQDGDKITIESEGRRREIRWDDVRSLRTDEDLLEEYRERFAAVEESDAEGQFDLGRWSWRVGLRDEARSRFRAAIALDPDHEGARTRLGYVRKGERWVLPDPEGFSGKRRGGVPPLPLDVARDAASAGEEDPSERSAAFRRLLARIESLREFLLRNLADPSAPDHDAALATLGMEAAEPRAAVTGEAAVKAVDAHLDASLRSRLAARFGEVAKETHRSLRAKHRKLNSFLAEAGSSSGGKGRERLLAALGAAREATLESIEKKGASFPEIERRIHPLMKVWATFQETLSSDLAPFLELTEEDAGEVLEVIEAESAALADVTAFLRGLGEETKPAPEGVVPAVRCLLMYRSGKLTEANDLAKGLGEWEETLLGRLRDLRVLAANEALRENRPEEGKAPNEFELEVSKLLNEYRQMLGRPVLEINPRLTECARGHSTEMVRLGYYDHFSPTPERRTPSMRAKLAGYEGPVSENIAKTDPLPSAKAAHLAWRRSLKHHLNMISTQWRCAGIGQYGATFTENFGTLSLVDR